MQKVGDTGDKSLFLAGANFWAILGHFWVIFGQFFGANFFGQKCNSAIFITFSISVLFRNNMVVMVMMVMMLVVMMMVLVMLVVMMMVLVMLVVIMVMVMITW